MNHTIKSSSSVFQVLRTLEQRYVINNLQPKQLELECSSSLSFPVSDIDEINILKDHIQVKLTVLGLFGVDSCLPHYFNDLLHADSENSSRLKMFLNIFHNCLYDLLYQIWKRQQVDISLELKQEYWFNFFSTLMPRLNLASEPITFAPNLLGNNRDLSGLYSLLNLYLPNLEIKVSTMNYKWSKADEENLLGVSILSLENNLLLGARYLSALNGISIFFGPMSFVEFLTLKKQKQSLLKLVNKYLDVFYEVKFIAIINYTDNVFSLGEKNLVLSENTYLGEQKIQIKKYF